MGEPEYTGLLKIGVAVAIYNSDGKVLLGKRIGKFGDGTYQFPGGHAEIYEDIYDTAIREVKEETNLSLDASTLSFICCQYDIFNGILYKTYFMMAGLIGLEGDVLNMEPNKCEGWDWYSIDELPSPLFAISEQTYKQIFSPQDYWINLK